MALDYGKMEFAVSFKPITAFPLDSRSYYESLAAAEAAAATAVEAGSDQGTVYFGQTFVVVENGVAQMLQVQPDGTLSEIGGKIEIDKNQFVIDEETGKLNLFGFADAVAGAQPVVEEVEVEGKKVKRIKWVKPDTTTVDGLATAVADLETAQAALEKRVAANEVAIGDADSGLVKALNDVAADVALKANAADVYTKTEADKAHGDLTTEIGKKANAADVYTKDEADAAHNGLTTEIGKKANASDVYTKTEIDGKVETINGAIAEKAAAADVYTKSEVYTKTETDTAIAKAVTEADHLKRIILPAPSGEETVEDVINTWLTANDLAAAADQYIYMIPTGLQQDDNKYYEYIILVEGENLVVEQVGNWEVDLSDYVTEKEFEDYLKSYYTSETVDRILEAYATTAAVSEAIGESLKNYYTIEQIGNFLDAIYTKEDIDKLIAGYYTKSKVDELIAPLATKQELTDSLAGKVDNDDLADYYTKAEANDLLDDKADKSTTYTKDEVDGFLNGKVDNADLDAYYTKTEADEKFVAQEEGKSLVSNAEITKLATVKENAEENYVKSVDDHFEVSEAGELTLKAVAIDEVTGLQDALDGKVAKQYFTVTDEETGETTTVEGSLLSPTDKSKLNALVIGENGVEISGKVNAANVEELDEWITKNRDSIDGLLSTTDSDKLTNIVDLIHSVEVTELNVDDNSKLSIVSVPVKKLDGLNTDEFEYNADQSILSIKAVPVAKLSGLGSEFTVDNGELKIVSVDVTKINGLADNYIDNTVFAAQIGNIEDLVHASGNENSTLIDEINDLNDRMSWKEMEG